MCDRIIRSSVVGVCLAVAFLATASTVAGQDLPPNLRALPPFDLQILPNAETGNLELRLSATSWNSGAGPLEMAAGPAVDGGQEVYQRVYNKAGGFTEQLAGTFVYHPAHGHFHFEQYAVYILNPVDGANSKRQSYKTSFCVMDTVKVDTRLPGAAKKQIYGSCNRFLQGMSVGWGDTYGWNLAGQAIDLTGSSDGKYELTVTFDPENRIIESNDADNSACVLLQISVVNRTVQTLGGCGITGSNPVSVSSITPDSTSVGTITDVTITGANFTPGIAVGFENGVGPTPVATNVTVLNSSTIVATVTIKGGGGRRDDPVWDVRVGSAVLRDAFVVVR